MQARNLFSERGGPESVEGMKPPESVLVAHACLAPADAGVWYNLHTYARWSSDGGAELPCVGCGQPSTTTFVAVRPLG